MAIRLRKLNLITQAVVNEILAEDGRFVWRQRPPPPDEDEEDDQGGFGRRQEEMRLSEVGFAYPKIVLGALRRNLIDTYDACQFLNLRGGNLDALEERVRDAEARYS